jgi:hypothetical protein
MFDEFIEFPRIHLQRSRWERWEEVAEHGRAILDVPADPPGVYEVAYCHDEPRLYTGRSIDLRSRVLHALPRGTMAHPAGDAIRANEEVWRLRIRWALTDRPAAVEEEFHRRHIERFGALPQYTQHT